MRRDDSYEHRKTNITTHNILLFVLFLAMFIAITGLSIMVFSMNKTLKEQSFLIKIPPELHPQIIATFQKSAELVKGKAIASFRQSY